MANAKEVVIDVKNLSVGFHVRGKKTNVIRNISFPVYRGETLAIVGESGSGKSVTTKTFTGMLDSNGFISNGDIIFNDEQEVVERELKKAFGDIHLFYAEDTENFYGGTFTCFTRVNGLLGQIEGKKIKFLKDVYMVYIIHLTK